MSTAESSNLLVSLEIILRFPQEISGSRKEKTDGGAWSLTSFADQSKWKGRSIELAWGCSLFWITTSRMHSSQNIWPKTSHLWVLGRNPYALPLLVFNSKPNSISFRPKNSKLAYMSWLFFSRLKVTVSSILLLVDVHWCWNFVRIQNMKF
jgi:hypothetical protein